MIDQPRLSSALETLDVLLPCSVSVVIVRPFAINPIVKFTLCGVVAATIGIALVSSLGLLVAGVSSALIIAMLWFAMNFIGRLWVANKALPSLRADEVQLIVNETSRSPQLRASDSIVAAINSDLWHDLVAKLQTIFDNKPVYDGVADACELLASHLVEELGKASFTKQKPLMHVIS